MADVQVTESIDVAPETVYRLVSDVARMGEWSPENTGGRWLDGAPGAAVGARFRGDNRDGWRRWSTTCTVTAAEPGRRFGFAVRFAGFHVADWAYLMRPTDGGCEVVEEWTDRRPFWMRLTAPLATGVGDRAAHNRDGMRRTLVALKAAAETAG